MVLERQVKKLLLQEMKEVVFTLIKEWPGIPHLHTISRARYVADLKGSPLTARELEGIQVRKVSAVSC
jgi:hypothetical protein